MALHPHTPAHPSPSMLFLGVWPELEDALCDALEAARAGDPLRPVTVVCGSGAARAYLRRRLVALAGAHAAIEFLTVHELAGRLGAPLLRAAGRHPLTPLAASRLVRRLVSERGAGWHFGPVAHTPGLSAALLHSLSDLREAGAAPGLSSRAGGAALEALDDLLGGFQAGLDEAGLYDDPMLYSAAATALTAGDTAGLGDWVAVYGLYDLPGMQQTLVRALGATRPLHVFLPWTPQSSYAGPARDLFSSFCDRVVELAPPDGAGPARDLDVLSRHLAAPAQQRAAKAGYGVAPRRDGSLLFVSCLDDAAERRAAAREAIAALERGHPAVDIALVHPERAWRALLAEQLEAAGVPVAVTLPLPSAGQRLLRSLLDCLTPVTGGSFRRADVIAAAAALADAATGASCDAAPSLDAAEVARWDVLSREARVVGGLEQWRLRLAGGRIGTGEAVERLGAFVEALAALHERLQTLSSWRAFGAFLESELASLAPVPADDPVLQTLRALQAVAAVEPSCEWPAVATTLRESLDTAGVRLGQLGRHGVAVLSPQQLRGLRFAVVIMGGLTEGVLPPRPRLDPVLGDDDRAAVRDGFGLRLELSSDAPAEAALLFALTTASARDRLVLLHPRSDASTAAPRLPSRLLLLAQGVFEPGVPVAADADRAEAAGGLVVVEGAEGRCRLPDGPDSETDRADRGAAQGVWLSTTEFDWAAASALRSCGRREARSYVTAVVGPAASRRRATLRNRHLHRFTRWDGMLPASAAQALAGQLLARPISASAVQAYLRCPFTFFVRYGLGIQPLEEPQDTLELLPSDLGQLVHEVLRRVYAGFVGAGWPPSMPDETSSHGEAGITGPADRSHELLEHALDGALDEAADEARRTGLIGFAPAWAPRLAALRRDLGRVLAADPCWGDGLRPAYLEWEFGESGPSIDVDGVKLRLRGRIDRIDRSDDGARVRVIDYKTGKGAGERLRLDGATEVQLPVYRLVAEALVPPPARVECVFRMVTRAGGLTDLTLAGDADESREALRAVLRTFVSGVQAGLYPRWRTERGSCISCAFAYGCGMDVAAADRKKADPSLAALRAFKEAEA